MSAPPDGPCHGHPTTWAPLRAAAVRSWLLAHNDGTCSAVSASRLHRRPTPPSRHATGAGSCSSLQMASIGLNVVLPAIDLRRILTSSTFTGTGSPLAALVATACALPLHLRHVSYALRGQRPTAAERTPCGVGGGKRHGGARRRAGMADELRAAGVVGARRCATTVVAAVLRRSRALRRSNRRIASPWSGALPVSPWHGAV
jgi:hypothetical protein